jgi:hypothetical protein
VILPPWRETFIRGAEATPPDTVSGHYEIYKDAGLEVALAR